jgi:hypothetical protein
MKEDIIIAVHIFTFFFLFALCVGAAVYFVETHSSPDGGKCDRHWEQRIGDQAWPFKQQDDFVCMVTGRTDDARIILESSGRWAVYIRGFAEGEFITEGSAKAHAEDIMKTFHTSRMIRFNSN